MALNKRNYIDNETIITAQNLNAIQDEVIRIGTALDDGDLKGDPGVSPTVAVSKTGKTTTITITDVNGQKKATIYDGDNGTNGTDGTNGKDGFSPTAKVTKSGKTATISITDKSGTTTATISDGADGKTPVKGTDYFTAADKEEFLSDVNAVRYVSQTLTNEQKAQARANIGADDILIVTVSNNIASHTPAEIKSAVDAGKLVFLLNGTAVATYSSGSTSSAKFDLYATLPTMNAFGATYYTVDSNKNVTSETKTASVTEIVNDAIDDLKESGELGSDDVLIVTSENGVASHSSAEIKAAVDAGKAVFLLSGDTPIPYYSYLDNKSLFRAYMNIPYYKAFGMLTYYVDSNKNVTSESENVVVSDVVDSAITDLRQSGVLVEDVLAALPTWTGGSY